MSGPRGVGRTTVAVNLAVAAAQTGKRVALVDASFQFGDVGVLLNLNPRNKSIADLAGELQARQGVLGQFIRDNFANLKDDEWQGQIELERSNGHVFQQHARLVHHPFGIDHQNLHVIGHSPAPPAFSIQLSAKLRADR